MSHLLREYFRKGLEQLDLFLNTRQVEGQVTYLSRAQVDKSAVTLVGIFQEEKYFPGIIDGWHPQLEVGQKLRAYARSSLIELERPLDQPTLPTLWCHLSRWERMH